MAARRIHIKGPYEHKEIEAGGAITPGHLCYVASTGKVLVHASQGGYHERLYAVEDALQGNPIGTAYSSGNIVSLNLMAPGSEIYAWLKAGANVAIGDTLISAADGTLIGQDEATTTTNVKQIAAIALEAKDLSASGTVNTLIKVRIV